MGFRLSVYVQALGCELMLLSSTNLESSRLVISTPELDYYFILFFSVFSLASLRCPVLLSGLPYAIDFCKINNLLELNSCLRWRTGEDLEKLRDLNPTTLYDWT